MTPRWWFGAFASTAAAAVVTAGTWVTVNHRAASRLPSSPARASPASGPAGEDVVCVASDHILRSRQGACAAGETRLDLQMPGNALVDCDSCDEAGRPEPTDRPRDADPRLAAIERRIEQLRRAPLFEVVNDKGVVIFSVAPENVKIFDSAHNLRARIHADDRGGNMSVFSGDYERSAFLGSSGSESGVLMFQNGVKRFEGGIRAAGNASMIFSGDGGGMMAAVGESRAGSGALTIADSNGNTRASMTVAEERGLFRVFNTKGSPVAALTQGEGGGLLQIGDADSETVVKMGVKDNRYGAVMTGPVAGLPYVPRSGLPGSYFFGCASCK